MSMSIAQSRQQLSALIAAAQLQPQTITNRNKTVAVLVSADYFARSEVAAKPVAKTFYSQWLQLREAWAPLDDTGLGTADTEARPAAWQRENAFVAPITGPRP